MVTPVAPTRPKSGTRGDLTALPPLALDRDRRYRVEHDASLRAPHPTPNTFEALSAWFRDAWEASLPRRTHVVGVEDGSALGAPRMSGQMHARTDHASDQGWGVTGWDRDGQPRGVDRDSGLTRDPFLFYLEMRLRSREPREREGAKALVRWAYLAWDVEEAAHSAFVRRIKEHMEAPDDWTGYVVEAHRSLLESAIRQLHHDCQREPVRYSICPACRRRECMCGQRSEAQVNAEEAV